MALLQMKRENEKAIQPGLVGIMEVCGSYLKNSPSSHCISATLHTEPLGRGQRNRDWYPGFNLDAHLVHLRSSGLLSSQSRAIVLDCLQFPLVQCRA